MAAGTAPIFLDSAKTAGVTFVNADGTTAKTLITAGADGGRVIALVATSDDTSAIDVQVFVQRAGAGTAYLLGTKQSAIGAGNTDGAAPTDLLAQLVTDPTDGSLILGPGDVVKVGPKAAVTAAKTCYITGQYGDY